MNAHQPWSNSGGVIVNNDSIQASQQKSMAQPQIKPSSSHFNNANITSPTNHSPVPSNILPSNSKTHAPHANPVTSPQSDPHPSMHHHHASHTTSSNRLPSNSGDASAAHRIQSSFVEQQRQQWRANVPDTGSHPNTPTCSCTPAPISTTNQSHKLLSISQQQPITNSTTQEEESPTGNEIPSDLSPFLVNPDILFHQQDIFDLPTFNHLAREAAAEYARRAGNNAANIKPFEPIVEILEENVIPLENTIIDATPIIESSSEHEPIPVLPAVDPFPERTVWSEQQAAERKKLIDEDASLKQLEDHIGMYQRDHRRLLESFDMKLSGLNREYQQLMKRNLTLQQLSEKNSLMLQLSRNRRNLETMAMSDSSDLFSSPSLSSKAFRSLAGSASSSASSSPYTPYRINSNSMSVRHISQQPDSPNSVSKDFM